jgi:hypothetical protein
MVADDWPAIAALAMSNRPSRHIRAAFIAIHVLEMY